MRNVLILKWLFKYASLAMYSGIPSNSWILKCNIGLIAKSFKALFIQKKNWKHYCNTQHMEFMHGWLVQVELHGAWFLEVAQHQLIRSGEFHSLGEEISCTTVLAFFVFVVKFSVGNCPIWKWYVPQTWQNISPLIPYSGLLLRGPNFYETAEMASSRNFCDC